MSRERLMIVGAGGHGRELLDILEAGRARADRAGEAYRYDFGGFLAEDFDPELLARRGTVCVGPPGALGDLDAVYVIGIGDSATRSRVAAELQALGRVADPLVHPDAVLGSDLSLGAGVAIAAGAHLTTNVEVGRHTHLNIGAVVSHDCVLGDFVTVSPGVLVNGSCSIGDGVFLGTGAIVTPGCRIGADATIGAGAVVTADVPSGVTAVGVPARW